MKKLLRVAGAAALAIVAVIAGYLWPLIHRGAAPETGSRAIPGLTAKVRIIRDHASIPHIFAQDRFDLMRAFGYAQAQDRMFQIELRRRLAEGKLAEIFGPDLVETDYAYRLLDPDAYARASLDACPPDDRAQTQAFVDGVNAWIDLNQNAPSLPFWLLGLKPQHVTLLDLEAGGLATGMLLQNNLSEEIFYLNIARRIAPDRIAELFPLYPGLPPEQPPAPTAAFIAASAATFRIAPGLAQLARQSIAASNNWVIDGSKSVSGKPVLANDPHLPQSIPSIWYEAVLATPDGFETGAAVAGSPTLALGTNGHVAWAVTSAQADVIDLSLERLSADGRSYLFKDQWHPLQSRAVTIRVKDQPDVIRTVLSTQHGPLVSELLATGGNRFSEVKLRGKYAVAMRYAGLTPGGAEQAGFGAARARNGHELVEAYRSFAVTPLNLVWADEAGNIGWHVTGAIPNRLRFDGKYPTPGWTGEFEWHGMIPYDQLPQVENPPSHFIVTANDRMADVSWNGSFVAPWRSQRISQLIAAQPRLAIEDFERIQNDRIALDGLKLKTMLLEAGDGGDPDLRWALGKLAAWNGSMDGANLPAALISAVGITLAARMFRPMLGADYDSLLRVADVGGYSAVEDVLNHPDSALWPRDAAGHADSPGVLRASLKDAMNLLRDKLGRDRERWQWGDLSRITFKNPLGERGGLVGWYFNRGPLASAGGRHTVNNGWFDLGDPFDAVQISSYRYIVDLAHPEHALGMNHSGESETPASAHYADLIEPWRACSYHPLDASLQAAEADRESELDLVPR